jgi:membrane protease YdiL (CAAX protease family)
MSPNSSKPVPGLAQALLLLGLYFGLTTVVILSLQWARLPIDAMTVFLLRLIIAWPITLWVGLRWSKHAFADAFPLKQFPFRSLPAICITTFGVTILILDAVKCLPAYQFFHEAHTKDLAGTSKLTLFLPVIVVAPIAEELFFRGLVLRGFLGRYSVFQAVGMSALLFSLIHLNIWTAIAVLPLGFGFAWLRLRTNSLVPNILSHMTVSITTNYLVAPLTLAFGGNPEVATEVVHFPPLLLAIGGATAVIGGIVLWRQLARQLMKPGVSSMTSSS